jgi:hypothetical protein
MARTLDTERAPESPTPEGRAPERPTPERQRADEELVMFLEPDQLVVDKSRPVPRAPLSRRADVALWVLRVFSVIVGAMVIYTFVSQVAH